MIFSETTGNPTGDNVQSVTIGDLTISQFGDGQLWIESKNDCDAGSFSEVDVENALLEFYRENF